MGNSPFDAPLESLMRIPNIFPLLDTWKTSYHKFIYLFSYLNISGFPDVTKEQDLIYLLYRIIENTAGRACMGAPISWQAAKG